MVAAILEYQRRALYPEVYRWVIVLALLDVLLTMIVLALGGREANAVAAAVIARAGMPGMVLLKTAGVGMALVACEFVGRQRPKAGLRLAQFALAANTAAVTLCGIFLGVYVVTILLW